MCFFISNRFLGIERAEKLKVQWTVSPPRRESVDLLSVVREQRKMCACVVRVYCIGQAARFPMGVPHKKRIFDAFFNLIVLRNRINLTAVVYSVLYGYLFFILIKNLKFGIAFYFDIL